MQARMIGTFEMIGGWRLWTDTWQECERFLPKM